MASAGAPFATFGLATYQAAFLWNTGPHHVVTATSKTEIGGVLRVILWPGSYLCGCQGYVYAGGRPPFQGGQRVMTRRNVLLQN